MRLVSRNVAAMRSNVWPPPTPRREESGGGAIALILLGILAMCGAGALFVAAQGNIGSDNPFMRGDQSTDANYTPALLVLGLGAFMVLLGVILLGSRRH